VPVAIVLAAAVILGGVVVVAMGRGGELSRERPELPLQTDFRNWSDVAEYQPPPALIGYDARATQHALSLIARTLAERDAEIEWLRNRIAELRPAGSGSRATADISAEPEDAVDEDDLAEQTHGDNGSRWFGAPPPAAANVLAAQDLVEAGDSVEAAESTGLEDPIDAADAVTATEATEASEASETADADGAGADSAGADTADAASADADRADVAGAAGARAVEAQTAGAPE
jgi:hypothetical protein